MDNQVRIFRKNPFGWWDKDVMRYLRKKYGDNKRTFNLIRSVYLALCEIESDFNDKPISFFTKTVGTYAGLSRAVTGRYINLLIDEGLIRRSQIKDPKTNLFSSGTVIELLGLEKADDKGNDPLYGIPDNGAPRQPVSYTALKKINTDKKLNINVNDDIKNSVKEKTGSLSSLKDILNQYGLKKPKNTDQPDTVIQRDYIAQEIAYKLGDPKSLGCYRKIADKVPQDIIFDVLASVKDVAQSGKIRQSRGALFVEIIKKVAKNRNIELGFNQGGEKIKNDKTKSPTNFETNAK